jgi:DNA modification methylase
MNRIDFGDCRETMRRWAADGVKVQTCVTSPPYFGLRDYGHEGQIGLEPTPEAYIAAMVEVFRCVRDVLADDGTLWLNIADSYAGGGGFSPNSPSNQAGSKQTTHKGSIRGTIKPQGEVKAKDLIGIPWMLAFALRADGWYLRQDIIWHKPNPMPESVRDRCTKAHEYIFLLSKSERYYFDAEAISEPAINAGKVVTNNNGKNGQMGDFGATRGGFMTPEGVTVKDTRNKRSVWTVTTKPYKGAHFATFPPDLITPCILAGSKQGDVVLDPFMGSGTTAQVAVQHGRHYLGCELNPAYEAMQQERLTGAQVNLL